MKTVKQDLCENMRKYHRISDTVSLSIKILPWADARLLHNPDNKMPQHRFMIKANLERLSRELQPLHKVIEASNANVAQYLSILDRKMSILSEFLLEDEQSDEECEIMDVVFGGGGLSFISHKAIQAGVMLETTMILMPENRKIFSYARVVSCTKVESKKNCHNYKIAIEFKFMDDDVRDLITRHVLLKEQELRNNVRL